MRFISPMALSFTSGMKVEFIHHLDFLIILYPLPFKIQKPEHQNKNKNTAEATMQ